MKKQFVFFFWFVDWSIGLHLNINPIQGRALVYMLDEDLNLEKNEKGGNVIGIVTLKDSKCIGFQD